MKTKKELIREYKQLKPAMGVFRMKNQVTGRALIEGSLNIPAKWNRLKMELKFGSHKNLELQRDWNEFGPDNFVFEILSELEPREEKNANYRQELKVLEEMIVNELTVSPENRY